MQINCEHFRQRTGQVDWIYIMSFWILLQSPPLQASPHVTTHHLHEWLQKQTLHYGCAGHPQAVGAVSAIAQVAPSQHSSICLQLRGKSRARAANLLHPVELILDFGAVTATFLRAFHQPQ